MEDIIMEDVEEETPAPPTLPDYSIKEWNGVVRDASKELQMRRCVAYCLENDYNINDRNLFIKQAREEWSFAKNRAYIHGTSVYLTAELLNKNRIITIHRFLKQDYNLTLDNYTQSTVRKCRELFERFLYENEYNLKDLRLVPGSAIDQESGTCWLAASLNLLLNIPEIRIVLWNAFGIKHPKRQHTIFELFITTTLGNRIMNNYTIEYLKRSRNLTQKEKKVIASDIGSSIDRITPWKGGFPELLVKSIKKVLNLQYLYSTSNVKSYVRIRKNLNYVVSNVNTGHFKSYNGGLWAAMLYTFRKIPRLRGIILTGWRYNENNEKIGHAIAISKVAGLENDILRVYNWGVHGDEKMLYEFFKVFNKDVTMTMYEYETSTVRKLNFNSPIRKKSPQINKKLPRPNCTPRQVYDRSLKRCRDKKIFPRPKCSPRQVYDRSLRKCRDKKIFPRPKCSPRQVYDRSLRKCRNKKIFPRPKCSPHQVYDRSLRKCRDRKR